MPIVESSDPKAYAAVSRQLESSVVLTEPEFVKLWKEWSESQSSALFDRMMECNLKMVFKIANAVCLTTGLEILDGYQAGCISLARLIPRFEPDKGVRFSSFEWDLIKRDIVTAARKDRIVPFQVAAERRWSRLEKMRKKLKQELDRMPSAGELASALDWKEKTVTDLERAYNSTRSVASLSSPQKSGQGLVGDDVAWSPESPWNISGETAKNILRLLEGLGRKERAVCLGKFIAPILGQEVPTEVEIANYLGISKERVRQIKEKLYIKLRPRCCEIFGVSM